MFQLIIATSLILSSPKPRLIYVGDPMCSWCYGFSDELEYIVEKYSSSMDFEMVMGGLRPYNRESMHELKDFLIHHWEDVSRASGQEFSYKILDDKSIPYDTEPPSRATIVVRKLAPESELRFFKAVQKSFYLNNQDLNLKKSYYPILKSIDVNIEDFNKLYDSLEMKEASRKDFQRAANLGVRGFPSILVIKDGNVHIISNGYAKRSIIEKKIDKLLKD